MQKVGNSQRYLVLQTNIYRLVWGRESLEAKYAQGWDVNDGDTSKRKTQVLDRGLHRKGVCIFNKNKRANITWDPGRKERAAGHRPQRIDNNRNPSL